MSYTAVSHCGNDHLHWIKDIGFYDEELDMLEKRLIEIVQKNNSKEVMTSVEHFQNQFIVQRNNIDELLHSINEHDRNVAADAQAHGGKMELTRVEDHRILKEQVEIFEKVFNELRLEYNQFLAKWM